MAKPKAPRWLTEAFRDGVDEREAARLGNVPAPPTAGRYIGPMPWCWLAQHDPARRPCSGPLERFHFIPRQRVENALWPLLAFATYHEPASLQPSASEVIYRPGGKTIAIWDDLILLAAWDPRNGGIGCEGHHRRFDSHLTPTLVVPHLALPGHVHDFANDWGLVFEVERRFPR